MMSFLCNLFNKNKSSPAKEVKKNETNDYCADLPCKNFFRVIVYSITLFLSTSIIISGVQSECTQTNDIIFISDVSTYGTDLNTCVETGNKICKVNSFIKNVSNNINFDESQVGFIQYGSIAHNVIPIELAKTYDSFVNYVMSEPPIKTAINGNTPFISNAFSVALDGFRKVSSNLHQKIVIVITGDGYEYPNYPDVNSANYISNMMKQEAILITSIYVGTNVSHIEQLKSFSSIGYMLTANSFDDLNDESNDIFKSSSLTVCSQINYCDSFEFPCNNNGICENTQYGYRCYCNNGFNQIDNCKTFDFCFGNNKCLNGGTCVSLNNRFICNCLNGFSGPVCDTLNSCILNNTCKNDATCVTTGDTYYCKCKPGFSGLLCDTIIECPIIDIKYGYNNTNCNKQSSCAITCEYGYIPSYKYVYCRAGSWYPSNVQCIKDLCLPNPCQNNGICTLTNSNTFMCTCSSCFTGPTCDASLNCPIYLPGSNLMYYECNTTYDGALCPILCNSGYYSTFKYSICRCGLWDEHMCSPIVNGNWSNWSECSCASSLCGVTTNCTMTRSCTNPYPSNGGLDCIGQSIMTTQCPYIECNTTDDWNNWTLTNISVPTKCGESEFTLCTYTRTCKKDICIGGILNSTKTVKCSTVPFHCPINCTWTNWLELPYNGNIECGKYYKCNFIRNATGPYYGGAMCTGQPTKYDNCTNVRFVQCPINGHWNEWSNCTCSNDNIKKQIKLSPLSSKIKICHYTGNGKYVEIELDENGLNGHYNHVNDIIPAPKNGCNELASFCINSYCTQVRTCTTPLYNGSLCKCVSGLNCTIEYKMCNLIPHCGYWTEWSNPVVMKNDYTCNTFPKCIRYRNCIDGICKCSNGSDCYNESNIVNCGDKIVCKKCNQKINTTFDKCSNNTTLINFTCKCNPGFDCVDTCDDEDNSCIVVHRTNDKQYIRILLHSETNDHYDKDECKMRKLIAGSDLSHTNIVVTSITTTPIKCCPKDTSFILTQNTCIDSHGTTYPPNDCVQNYSKCIALNLNDIKQQKLNCNDNKNDKHYYHRSYLNIASNLSYYVTDIVYYYINIDHANVTKHIASLGTQLKSSIKNTKTYVYISTYDSIYNSIYNSTWIYVANATQNITIIDNIVLLEVNKNNNIGTMIIVITLTVFGAISLLIVMCVFVCFGAKKIINPNIAQKYFKKENFDTI